MTWLSELSWPVLIIVCLTLGLAPFNPPHIVEKLQMLSEGTLSKPLDWFDLLMHGVPWLLLFAKVTQTLVTGGER
ncbi:MAG: hypothetical protein ACPGU1_13380 [Myxococcota bacterium]